MIGKTKQAIFAVVVIAAVTFGAVSTTLVQSADAMEIIYCERNVKCVGTPGNDYIIGTSYGDLIWGNGGNDTIRGNEGNDVIYGDGCDYTDSSCTDGKDTIYGGPGDDIIHHDGSMDAHNAQDYQKDWINCGKGQDIVFYKPLTDGDVLFKIGSNGVHGCETKKTDNS